MQHQLARLFNQINSYSRIGYFYIDFNVGTIQFRSIKYLNIPLHITSLTNKQQLIMYSMDKDKT
jgi:hypothetical protein